MHVKRALRTVSGLLAVGAVVLLRCTCDSGTEALTESPPELPYRTMTMVSCTYAVPAPGLMDIVIPEVRTCDSLGQPAVLPEQATQVPYILEGNSLRLALKEMIPLIRVMTSGPSFSSDIPGILDILDTAELPEGLTLYGKLKRMDDGVGVEGLWRFDSMAPPIVNGFIPPDILQSMRESDDGEATMLFEFREPVLTGMLNRQVYGDAAVEEVIDTILYDIVITSERDSLWSIAGNLSGDSVFISADQSGNMTYRHSDTAYEVYTYHSWPDPAQCPNAVAPTWWWPAFLEPNQRP